MSIQKDPLHLNNPPYPSVEEPNSTVDYVMRAKKFAIISAVIAMVTAILLPLYDIIGLGWAWNTIYIFPISFAFSYHAFRSASQAKSERLSTGYAKYLAALPFLGLAVLIFAIGSLAAKDTTGMGGLLIMVMPLMMTPGALVAITLGCKLNRIFEEKDQEALPVRPGNSIMISVLRIMAALSLTPLLCIIYLSTLF